MYILDSSTEDQIRFIALAFTPMNTMFSLKLCIPTKFTMH